MFTDVFSIHDMTYCIHYTIRTYTVQKPDICIVYIEQYTRSICIVYIEQYTRSAASAPRVTSSVFNAAIKVLFGKVHLPNYFKPFSCIGGIKNCINTNIFCLQSMNMFTSAKHIPLISPLCEEINIIVNKKLHSVRYKSDVQHLVDM